MLFFLKKQVFKCFFSSFLNSLISFEYTEVACAPRRRFGMGVAALSPNIFYMRGNHN